MKVLSEPRLAPRATVVVVVAPVVLRVVIDVVYPVLPLVKRLEVEREQLSARRVGVVRLDRLQVLLVMVSFVVALIARLRVGVKVVRQQPHPLCADEDGKNSLSRLVGLRALDESSVSQLEQLPLDNCDFFTAVRVLLLRVALPVAPVALVLTG